MSREIYNTFNTRNGTWGVIILFGLLSKSNYGDGFDTLAFASRSFGCVVLDNLTELDTVLVPVELLSVLEVDTDVERFLFNTVVSVGATDEALRFAVVVELFVGSGSVV